jgi:hypothetical protein
VSFSAVSGFCIYSAPRENAQNLNGELAHRADFEHFPGADKARSASERPTVKNAQRSEHEVLNRYLFYSF